ncbi:2'-5' RNA ligase family protein [Nonomuraea dietziae]|uniref:2'-5' RNA ligase family protein n=1 Tax=Nonomuraea dietziae TaxID=65515 RepID=UPI0033C9931C
MPRQTLQLERKAAGTAAAGVVAAQDEGIVEALVSVTNVVDNAGDLIVPGAYAETLAQRTPKGLFSHDDKVWVARTEAVEELLPGDPRLLAMVADRKDWPRNAGALYVKARFNLATTAGREAFSNVKFFGGDQEWSIGYTVPKGGSTRGGDGVRRIKKLSLYEYSPVLFGANSQTLTLSVKSALDGAEDLPGLIADCVRAGSPLEQKRHIIRAAREHGELGLLPAAWREDMDAKSALEDLAAGGALDATAGVERAGSPAAGEVKADRADAGSGVMVTFMLPPDLAEQLAVLDGVPAEELHVTLAYLGKDLDDDGMAAAAQAVREAAAVEEPLGGTIGGIGAFPPGEDGTPAFATVDVPGLEILRQRLVDRLEAAGVPVAANHGYTPHVTLTYLPEGAALPAPIPAQEVAFVEISLVRGTERTVFPLGATGQASEDDGLEDDGWGDLLDDLAVEETKGLDIEASSSQLPLEKPADEELVALLGRTEAAVKHALLDLEVKGGRVLSAANASDIARAMASLLAVLRRAGVEITDPDKPAEHEPERLPEEPTVRPDSTAPSALPAEMKSLTAAEIAEGAEIMAAVLGITS